MKGKAKLAAVAAGKIYYCQLDFDLIFTNVPRVVHCESDAIEEGEESCVQSEPERENCQKKRQQSWQGK